MATRYAASSAIPRIDRSPMDSPAQFALIAGGSLTALASLAHLACIWIGGPAYRFMGAGEAVARAAEAGQWRPVILTLAVALVLALWALYAFSALGLAPGLPLTRIALWVIGLVYLARAVVFPLLKPLFPDNSTAFWLLSSGICLILGLLYAFGAWRLEPDASRGS